MWSSWHCVSENGWSLWGQAVGEIAIVSCAYSFFGFRQNAVTSSSVVYAGNL